MDQLIVTCEHAGNEVPEKYRPHFTGHEHLLPTHRGWDPGALILAREMAARFSAPLHFETASRLLVDLNRSLTAHDLHAEPTRELPPAERDEMLDAYYHPHLRRVRAAVAAAIERGARVIHVASHSFTPELHGEVRTADIGLLYDPARPGEVAFSSAWLAALGVADPTLRLRRNYPYLGTGDGLITALRRLHPPDRYVGLELEVNQRYVEAGGPTWPRLRQTLVATLAAALDQMAQLRGGTGPDEG
ncbi:MAG: N-formylglutamate amidohydrolase [Caldimonas sp.]